MNCSTSKPYVLSFFWKIRRSHLNWMTRAKWSRFELCFRKSASPPRLLALLRTQLYTELSGMSIKISEVVQKLLGEDKSGRIFDWSVCLWVNQIPLPSGLSNGSFGLSSACFPAGWRRPPPVRALPDGSSSGITSSGSKGKRPLPGRIFVWMHTHPPHPSPLPQGERELSALFDGRSSLVGRFSHLSHFWPKSTFKISFVEIRISTYKANFLETTLGYLLNSFDDLDDLQVQFDFHVRL